MKRIKAEMFIIREPQPGKPEMFLKTDEGEFIAELPEHVCWKVHNETGVYLATINQIRLMNNG